MSTERERYMSNEEVDQLIADLNDPLYCQGYRDGYARGNARGNAEVAKLRAELDRLRLSTTYEPEGVDIVMGQLQKLRAERDQARVERDSLREVADVSGKLRAERDRAVADLAALRADLEKMRRKVSALAESVEAQCFLGSMVCEEHGVDIYDGECSLVHDIRALDGGEQS